MKAVLVESDLNPRRKKREYRRIDKKFWQSLQAMLKEYLSKRKEER